MLSLSHLSSPSLSFLLSGTLVQRKHTSPAPVSNLVDTIWTDQPPAPQRPVRVHPVKFAGVAVPEKLAAVRKLVVKERASSLVVMAMDEVHEPVGGWRLESGVMCEVPITLDFIGILYEVQTWGRAP